MAWSIYTICKASEWRQLSPLSDPPKAESTERAATGATGCPASGRRSLYSEFCIIVFTLTAFL